MRVEKLYKVKQENAKMELNTHFFGGGKKKKNNCVKTSQDENLFFAKKKKNASCFERS